jgi:hypothetical protein
MNIAHVTHPSADPAPSSQGSGDPAADPIGWSLRMLEHIVAVGMEMADSRLRQELLVEQALRQQVEAGQVVARPANPERAADDEAPDADVPEPAGKPPRGEVGLTFERLSRGIRLCLALHAQIRQDRQALGEKAAAEQTRRATFERNEQKRLQKARVKRAVGLAIDAEGKRGTREAMLRPLRERLDERLRDEDLDADLLKLPISEILERICGYLGLDPDWNLWKHEAWAQAEAEAAMPGSPYAKPPRAPQTAPAEAAPPVPTRAAPQTQPATTGCDPP